MDGGAGLRARQHLTALKSSCTVRTAHHEKTHHFQGLRVGQMAPERLLIIWAGTEASPSGIFVYP